MWDVSPQIANERVKGVSGIFYNLAAVLIAAAAARIYGDGGLTLTPALWMMGSLLLILTASQLLSLLQMEG